MPPFAQYYDPDPVGETVEQSKVRNLELNELGFKSQSHHP